MAQLSHLDARGQARMVDVSVKDDTVREAVATGQIRMKPETLRLIAQQAESGSTADGGLAPSGPSEDLKKGEVLAVARVAGINAAKHTWELIPMCHQLLLSGVSVDFEFDFEDGLVLITGKAKTRGKTGVEMEALTAVSVAALTIYDMAKAVDREMEIGAISLKSKTGGKSGDFRR